MPIVAASQGTIRVDVAFYDNAERERLLRYSTASVVQQLVEKPLEVSTAEFLSYYLFHRKRLGTPAYQNYRSIGYRLDVATSHLDGCIDFNGHSICTAVGVEQQLNEVSQHVGEAIGLQVVSRIHGLTEADWAPIDEQRGRGASPTLDFQLSSDDDHFIEVEHKGSSVVDNRTKDHTIREQKHKITVKKQRLDELAKQAGKQAPVSLRYGTITAVDHRRDGNVRCWLTDPPPGQADEEPRRFQLLQRVRYLRDWIAFISPRSQLAAALSTRVADMERLGNPFELSGVPLRRGNGERFEFAPLGPSRVHSTFLASKSRITDGPAGGVVVQLSNRALFLVGIREDLVMLASEQVFERITTYKSEPATIEKSVECVFSKGRFRSLRLPESIIRRTTGSGAYSAFSLPGRIHYSPSGLVFGLLRLPPE